jgi:ATP synthase protein I
LTSPSPDPPPSPLLSGIERRRLQRATWQREGERPLAQNLAMIGSLGWLIVVPALGGLFVGRWIDHRTGDGLTFTAASLVVGIGLGAWFAWLRMHDQ